MPIPNLIRPTKVTISPISRSTTTWDRDIREPLRTLGRATSIQIDAQPTCRSPSRNQVAFEGLSEDVKGFLTIRRVDAVALAYTPATGDKITKVGHSATELYIVKIGSLGHWQDTDGATLFRLYFSSRRPEAAAPTFV